jgi:putative acyl-CoA dehydrogenase
VDAVLAGLQPALEAEARLKAGAERIRAMLTRGAGLEAEARRLAEQLALVTAGALLRMHAPDFVADAFIGSRLGDAGWRQTYGAALAGADHDAILARAGAAL